LFLIHFNLFANSAIKLKHRLHLDSK